MTEQELADLIAERDMYRDAYAKLCGLFECLAGEVQAAIRHRESKGGQQAGIPRYVMVPPSVLKDLKWYCVQSGQWQGDPREK